MSRKWQVQNLRVGYQAKGKSWCCGSGVKPVGWHNVLFLREVILYSKTFHCLDETSPHYRERSALLKLCWFKDQSYLKKHTFTATPKTESRKLIWLMQDVNLNMFSFQQAMFPNSEDIIPCPQAKLANPFHEDIKGHSVTLASLIFFMESPFLLFSLLFFSRESYFLITRLNLWFYFMKNKCTSAVTEYAHLLPGDTDRLFTCL